MTQTPQDLVEVNAIRKEVTGDLDLVSIVFPKGTPDYYHATITLAYKLIRAKDLEGALTMIKSIPQSYYLEHLPRRMENDPLFAQLACKVADSFVEVGAVTSPFYNTPEKLYHQKSAQA